MSKWSTIIENKVSNRWLRENLKFLPLLLSIELVTLVLYLINVSMSGFPSDSSEQVKELMIFFELFFLPLCAINVIYLFQHWLDPNRSSNWISTTAKVTGMITGIILGTALVEYIDYKAGVVDDDYITFGGLQLSTITTNFISNVFFALIIGVPVFIRQSKRYDIQYQLKAKELELQRLQQLKSTAELEALHAKINPHFLYNSLNSITSLIHENQDKAERMVINLSYLFRHSINTNNDHYSTVEEELKMVGSYLEIEKVRFGEQLTYHIDTDDGCNKCRIPRFLIQPLIENAIKHGTSHVKYGVIRLTIKMEEDALIIKVCDNGPPFPDPLESGYGIKSMYDKLDILFPDNYVVNMTNGHDKCMVIILNNIRDHEVI